MMRRILLGLLIIMLAMGFATPLIGSEVTMRHWSTGVHREWGEVLAQRFEQAHPNVKIKHEYIPSEHMAEKTMIAIASDTTPDTLMGYIGRAASWWHLDVLESLSGTLPKEELEDYIPGLLEMLTIDGNLIAYPGLLGCRTFGANVNLLKQAGVESLVPSGESREWSLEAFNQALEKVSELEGVYGTGFFAGSTGGDYHTLGFFEMFGAYLYQDGDHTKTTLNTEDGVRTLDWIIDLVDRGIAAPGPAGTVGNNHREAFWSGKYGFGAHVPNPLQRKLNFESGMIDYPVEYRYVEFPHEEGVAPPPVFIGPDVVCVFKNSEDKKLAIEWAQFIMNREAIELLFTYCEHDPSPRRSVSPPLEHLGTLQRMMVKNGIGDLGLTSLHYREARNLFFPEIQAAFSGIKTPRQALDDFAEGVQKVWEKRD